MSELPDILEVFPRSAYDLRRNEIRSTVALLKSDEPIYRATRDELAGLLVRWAKDRSTRKPTPKGKTTGKRGRPRKTSDFEAQFLADRGRGLLRMAIQRNLTDRANAKTWLEQHLGPVEFARWKHATDKVAHMKSKRAKGK